ncbi:MAG: hypothetical protein ABR581_01415 [Thermoleophilaceae bacterium]
MLFDLRGRRRRAVQATYLTLAVLMGGGLVFFGIGGGTNGGLLDAFKGGGGGGGNDLTKKRIGRNEKRVTRDPRDTAALAELVRDNYQLATAQTTSSSTSFPKDARDELASAASWWQRYLKAAGRPDESLARLAMRIYVPGALNKPKQAEQAALVVADATKNPNDYLQLVGLASLAGDARTADLATQKAVDLAPKSQRDQVRLQAKQLKNPQPQPQPQGG